MIRLIDKVAKLVLVGVLVTILGNVGELHADASEQMGFTVNPTDEKYYGLGYFSFQAQQGKTVELPVTISNVSESAITVNITKLNALTSPYGGIQYVKESELPNSRLLDSNYAMAQYLEGDSSVTIAKGESKVVNLKLKTPSNLSKGTLLGGFEFKTKEGLTRVIGVEAIFSKEQVEVVSDVPVIENSPSSQYIRVPLENKHASISQKINLSYEVYNEDSELVYKGKTEQFKMSPLSSVGYIIDLGEDFYFDSGKYKIKVGVNEGESKIESKDYEVKVSEKVEEEFDKTVKNTEGKQFDEPFFKSTSFYGGLLSGVIVALIFFFFIIFFKRRKKDKDEEKGGDNGEN